MMGVLMRKGGSGWRRLIRRYVLSKGREGRELMEAGYGVRAWWPS
jgi:hypothetical protein